MAGNARRKVVVLGAGFGGLSAAKRLAGADVDLTIVDRRNHHLFQPLLYQVATAMLSPADIAVPIRSIVHPGGNARVEVLMDAVARIDRQDKRVLTSSGLSLEYDDLIVATGAQYAYFGHESDWAPHAPSLKTLDDALNIRRRILLAFEHAETARDRTARERLMRFVVIGGGPTGVETAGAIAELARASLVRDFQNIDPRDARVYLLEAQDTVLNGYPGHLGRYTVEKLKQMGVEVMTGTPVQDVSAAGVVLGDRTIEAANVFWSAGVKATPVGDWLGVDTERNGTISVGRDLLLPGTEDIYIVGDIGTVPGSDGQPLPALAPVAKQQGRYAAEAILRKMQGKAPQGPFRYRDWGTLATIGRSSAVGKFGPLEIKGFLAWLVWGAVHIAYLVGFRNRVSVIVNWFWAWMTYAKGARLITAPDDIREAAPQAIDEAEAGGSARPGKKRPEVEQTPGQQWSE